ncbi:hypothetical protein E8E13_002126 [Curvularia kusanoi]|uniref:Uncharacterized protein n=1 Tax=Curvularia kusanoi TaxID=90978 RepID=A0A9P4TFH1_CURKU|nr:hypothetical protein E8E13_002126 [Curvularia kusanoi]
MMRSPASYTLDNLLDYVIASPNNPFTNKQALQFPFGPVEFTERLILGDDGVYFKSLVLHIGYWGFGTDKCWASMFGSKVLFYRDDNTVPSVPGDPGVVLTEVASMSYLYKSRDGYYSKWQTPFSFITPKAFTGSWEERTGKALEMLNLLVSVLFQCNDYLCGLSGGRNCDIRDQFEKLCMMIIESGSDGRYTYVSRRDHDIALRCRKLVTEKCKELEEKAVMLDIQLSEALKHRRVLSDMQTQQDREITELFELKAETDKKILEMTQVMAAPRRYELDTLIDKILKAEGSPYRDRQELLDLLGDALFEQRDLAGGDLSTVALHIGLWRKSSSRCTRYWAVIIDDDVSYRIGDRKELKLPRGDEPRAPYSDKKAQFELEAPFRYTAPAAFINVKDTKEAWKQADLHLDAMIKVLFLRERLVSSIGAKEGNLLEQFQKFMNILHVQSGNIRAREIADTQWTIPEHDHEGRRAPRELSIHSPKRPKPATISEVHQMPGLLTSDQEAQEPASTPSKKPKETLVREATLSCLTRTKRSLQDSEEKDAALEAKLQEAEKRMSTLEVQLADAEQNRVNQLADSDQKLADLKAKINKDCEQDISELSCQFKEKWDEAQEQHRVELAEAVQEKEKRIGNLLQLFLGNLQSSKSTAERAANMARTGNW